MKAATKAQTAAIFSSRTREAEQNLRRYVNAQVRIHGIRRIKSYAAGLDSAYGRAILGILAEPAEREPCAKAIEQPDRSYRQCRKNAKAGSIYCAIHAVVLLAVMFSAACSSPTAPTPTITRTDKTPSTIAPTPTIKPEGK